MKTIPEMMEEALANSGLSRAEASRRATGNPTSFRDLVDRHASPRVDTLQKFARVFGTSVAYLIGEADDPAPSEPLRASDQNPRRWVVRANGGASFESEDRPVVGITLEDDEGVEERYLMPEPIARVLRARLDRGLGEIEEHEANLSSSLPSSA